MSPEEVVLIVRGWLDSKSELFLSASTINFSVFTKCRVVHIAGDNVTLWSTKDDTVFSFSVDSPHLSLSYSELREFKGRPGLENVPEEAWERSALVVTLPLGELDPSLRGAGFDVLQIFLLEL